MLEDNQPQEFTAHRPPGWDRTWVLFAALILIIGAAAGWLLLESQKRYIVKVNPPIDITDPSTEGYELILDPEFQEETLLKPGYLQVTTRLGLATITQITLADNASHPIGFLVYQENRAVPSVILSSDGNLLFYTDTYGNLHRFEIDTRTDDVLRAAANDAQNLGDYISYRVASFSPDNRFLAVRWTGWEIGGMAVMTSNGENYYQHVNADSLAWSPDSSQFVMTAANNYFGGEPAELYVANSSSPESGKNILPAELQTDDGALTKDVYTPDWSPDGSLIVVGYKYLDTALTDMDKQENAEKYQGIYTIRPDGSDFRQVTDNRSYSATPVWLDATKLAYSLSRYREGSNYGIYTINKDGSDNTERYKESTIAYRLSNLSPSRKYAIFETSDQTNPQIGTDAVEMRLIDLTRMQIVTVTNIENFAGWTGSS